MTLSAPGHRTGWLLTTPSSSLKMFFVTGISRRRNLRDLFIEATVEVAGPVASSTVRPVAIFSAIFLSGFGGPVVFSVGGGLHRHDRSLFLH